MAKKDLAQAKDAKKDEFYTQLSDIEEELRHYKQHFVGKVVLCNCDDPYESNFFRYFANNFNEFQLKKLVATGFETSPISNQLLELNFDWDADYQRVSLPNRGNKAHKIELTEVRDMNGDGAVNMFDVKEYLKTHKEAITRLKGSGDFRSPECIRLLREADIVVTNPPFSLFREYMAQLMAYNKKFVILGNMNALTYREVFPLIKDNKIWIGYGFNKAMVFKTTYPNVSETNKKMVRSKGYDPDKNFIITPSIAWFTNLEISKRHEEMILYKHYTPENYPKYDNYDAINVDKVSDIPCDYDGVMGVPITFLDKYNPEQFEIIKFRKGNDEKDLTIQGKSPYFRILIRRR